MTLLDCFDCNEGVAKEVRPEILCFIGGVLGQLRFGGSGQVSLPMVDTSERSCWLSWIGCCWGLSDTGT